MIDSGCSNKTIKLCQSQSETWSKCLNEKKEKSGNTCILFSLRIIDCYRLIACWWLPTPVVDNIQVNSGQYSAFHTISNRATIFTLCFWSRSSWFPSTALQNSRDFMFLLWFEMSWKILKTAQWSEHRE